MTNVEIIGKRIVFQPISQLVVGSENLAETIVFSLPRLYGDETDLSGFDFYLQFKNRNGEGEPLLLEKRLDGDRLELSWRPAATITQVPGRCQIQIYGLMTEDGETVRWSTQPIWIRIAEDLAPDPIVAAEPTVLVQYLGQFQGLRDEAEAAQAAAMGYRDEAETARTGAEAARDEAMATDMGLHLTDPLPHRFALDGVSYKYGFRAASDGTAQFCYEEVAE